MVSSVTSRCYTFSPCPLWLFQCYSMWVCVMRVRACLKGFLGTSKHHAMEKYVSSSTVAAQSINRLHVNTNKPYFLRVGCHQRWMVLKFIQQEAN